jgi:hypothetical protein
MPVLRPVKAVIWLCPAATPRAKQVLYLCAVGLAYRVARSWLAQVQPVSTLEMYLWVVDAVLLGRLGLFAWHPALLHLVLVVLYASRLLAEVQYQSQLEQQLVV